MKLVKWAKRKRLLVDARVQGTLLLRAALYWFTCMITLVILLLVWRMLTRPSQFLTAHLDDLWDSLGPVLVTSFLLMPLVMIDILRTSNRFAGPLWRLRSQMRKLARGEEVEPIRFRDDDFWHEIGDEFNAVLDRFEAERHETACRQADQDLRRAPVAADIERF